MGWGGVGKGGVGWANALAIQCECACLPYKQARRGEGRHNEDCRPPSWHSMPNPLPYTASLRLTLSPCQDAVDPAYGNEELAALRKEVQRLGHAAGELLREQEALVSDMERAVAKREVIGTKVRGLEG